MKFFRILAGFKAAGTVLPGGSAIRILHIRPRPRDMSMRSFGANQAISTTLAIVCHSIARREANAYEQRQKDEDERLSKK
ncbi:MAG: hypothetical protein ACYSR9_14650, partial [Planctomycetota bacterium]